MTIKARRERADTQKDMRAELQSQNQALARQERTRQT